MNSNAIDSKIHVIDKFLDDDECSNIIENAEQHGFEAAPIITSGGAKLTAETRNNDRFMFDDISFAHELWSRAKQVIPGSLYGRQAIGLNERFRIYRYRPGQRFYWHIDAPFRRNNGDMSLLTFIAYLNDGYLGGETRFETRSVHGAKGSALFFYHNLMHEGAEVTQGTKYALRTDVMFGPIGRFGA